MKFFVDTADVKEIRELNDLGLLDGVTTNPSLILKSGGKIAEVTKEICDIVKGPVSAEVTATEYSEMMTRGQGAGQDRRQHLHQGAADAGRPEGLQGDPLGRQRMVNVTLCFSANQALLAAKAGASFISPFVGRIDDMGIDGMELIAEIRHDLRQLRLPDRDPRRLDPHREPRQAGGPDRRRRRDRAAGDAEGAGQASADRQGAGAASSPTGPRPARRSADDRAWRRRARTASPRRCSKRLTRAASASRSPSAYPDFSTGDAYAVTARLRQIADGPRRDADRPQDRLHQPQHLGRVRRLRADLGRHVRRHRPLRSCQATGSRVMHLPEPRIEPEIVLGLEVAI